VEARAVAAEGEGEDPEERAGVPVQRAVAAEEARGGDERGAGGQTEQDLARDLVGDLAALLLAFPANARLAAGVGHGRLAQLSCCCSSAWWWWELCGGALLEL